MVKMSMAGGGAWEIKREQVMAAISDRTRAALNISTQIAAGPHPEQRLADLRMLEGAISDEISELCAVLRGLRLGDLSFMAQMPLGRLDELLNAGTGRVARPQRGGPLQGRVNMEALSRTIKRVFDMPIASSSDEAAAAAAREELARLQI